jgi:hypothetical protein
MLIPDDVPAPWRVVDDMSPVPKSISSALEAGVSPEVSDTDPALVSWDMIENTDNGMRMILRMVPEYAVGQVGPIIGAIVSGLVAFPRKGSRELKGADLRDIPTLTIQTRVGLRKAETNTALAEALGSVDPKLIHLGEVARRWLELKEANVGNPSRVIADEHNRGLSTVQAWVAEARKAGLLSRTSQGRAGRPPAASAGSNA